MSEQRTNPALDEPVPTCRCEQVYKCVRERCAKCCYCGSPWEAQPTPSPSPVPYHDPVRFTMERRGVGWKVVVEDIDHGREISKHARASFIAGVQSFTLADVEDDEEAIPHCEHIAKMFADALDKLRMGQPKDDLAKALVVVLEHVDEWHFDDNPIDHSTCLSCGWDSKKDGRHMEGFKHHPGCELHAAMLVCERFIEDRTGGAKSWEEWQAAGAPGHPLAVDSQVPAVAQPTANPRDAALVAELRQFHHYEAAKRLEELLADAKDDPEV